MDYTPNGQKPYEESSYSVVQDSYDKDLYKMAKKRVQERIGLLCHVAVFLMINFMLMILSISEGEFWFLFVTCSWGAGLVCHMISYIFAATPEAINREYVRIREKHRK